MGDMFPSDAPNQARRKSPPPATPLPRRGFPGVRLEGRVRVTSVEIVAVELLTPAFAIFRSAHPGIEVDLTADARSLSLTRREADIAVRLVRLEQNDLAVRRVGVLGFGVYAARAYLDHHGIPDFAAGAQGHATILNPPDTMHLPEMAWFAALTQGARPAIRHNSRYGQRAAAEAGMGLAVLSRFMGDSTGLVRLVTPSRAPSREIFLAVHNDIRNTPRIRAVTECIATTMRANAMRLDPSD
jgi:DNA-binding transcriptional LysR family regulator